MSVAQAVGWDDESPQWRLGPGSRRDTAGRVVALALDRQREIARRHEPGLLAGGVEDLHQYRVAVRRARSVLGASKRILGEDRRHASAVALRRLAGLTSPVRDLDVLLDDLPGLMDAMGTGEDPAALVEVISARRARAREELAAEITGAGGAATRRVWTAAADVHPLGAGAWGPDALEPAGPVLDELLVVSWRKARRAGRTAARSDQLEHWHDLRKSLKRLRYLLECFGELYPSERLDPTLRPLRRLQVRIGLLQDLRVQGELLTEASCELGATGDVGGATLASSLAAHTSGELVRAHRRCMKAWQRYDVAGTRRALERLVGS